MAYSNPANAAMPYFNQIPGTITPYYQPYINSGSHALNTLNQQYQTLLNNPAALQSLAGQGFTESPGYQYNYNKGMNAANSAAATGGMLGTPMHQQAAAGISENLANQEFGDYLHTNLGLYGQGLSGEQGMNQMGYQASSSLADALGANLMNQGGMAYAGQANQNQANADFWKTLLGAGATVGGAALSFL